MQSDQRSTCAMKSHFMLVDCEQVEHVSYLEACGRSSRNSESQLNAATCAELTSEVTRAQGDDSLKVEVNDELNAPLKVEVRDELNAKTDCPSDKYGDIEITAQTDSIAIKVMCYTLKGGKISPLAGFNFKTYILNFQFSFCCRDDSFKFTS